MKWYNAVIGVAFVIAMVMLAGTMGGCGTTTVIIERTVTPSASPTASAAPIPATTPSLTDSDREGIATIERLLPDLKHILRDENRALNYGADGGSVDGLYNRMSHFSDEWKEFSADYRSTNGGDVYGGKVAKLEELFEDAAGHVRKYGRALIRALTESADSNGSVVSGAKNRLWAEQGIEAVEDELTRLHDLGDDTT